jgi:anti-sigma B factor antagonist
VPIQLDSRRVGEITVVNCRGRIVEGDESLALNTFLEDLLPFGPRLVLNLGEVDFLDSGGLGLLIRYLTRTKNEGGNLNLCALTPKMVEILRITHLDTLFESFTSEADAIAACYQRAGTAAESSPLRTDILCVDTSGDVQAYLRQLLVQAGYGVLTAGNLPDGLILLKATQPKLVVVGAGLHQARNTVSAETFNKLADALSVIELPEDFSHRDAGEAGQRLLGQVRDRLAPS